MATASTTMQDTTLTSDTTSTTMQDHDTTTAPGADTVKMKPPPDGKGPERNGSGQLGEKGLPAPPTSPSVTEVVDDDDGGESHESDATVQKPTVPPKSTPPAPLLSSPLPATFATDASASKVGETEKLGAAHGQGHGGLDGFGIAVGKVSRAMKTGLLTKVGQGFGLGLLAPSPLPTKMKAGTMETESPWQIVDTTPAQVPNEGKGLLSSAALQHRRTVLVHLSKALFQRQQHSTITPSVVVDPIESALDQMGDAIAKEGWFSVGLGDKEGVNDEQLASGSKRLPSPPLRGPLELLHQLSSSCPPQPSKTILVLCSKVDLHLQTATSSFDQAQWKFLPGVFDVDTDAQVLYGFPQLQQLFSSLEISDGSHSRSLNAISTRIVGGTFVFSATPHYSLPSASKVVDESPNPIPIPSDTLTTAPIGSTLLSFLRLGIYTHLSLVFEDALWSDLGVDLDSAPGAQSSHGGTKGRGRKWQKVRIAGADEEEDEHGEGAGGRVRPARRQSTGLGIGFGFGLGGLFSKSTDVKAGVVDAGPSKAPRRRSLDSGRPQYRDSDTTPIPTPAIQRRFSIRTPPPLSSNARVASDLEIRDHRHGHGQGGGGLLRRLTTFGHGHHHLPSHSHPPVPTPAVSSKPKAIALEDKAHNGAVVDKDLDWNTRTRLIRVLELLSTSPPGRVSMSFPRDSAHWTSLAPGTGLRSNIGVLDASVSERRKRADFDFVQAFLAHQSMNVLWAVDSVSQRRDPRLRTGDGPKAKEREDSGGASGFSTTATTTTEGGSTISSGTVSTTSSASAITSSSASSTPKPTDSYMSHSPVAGDSGILQGAPPQSQGKHSEPSESECVTVVERHRRVLPFYPTSDSSSRPGDKEVSLGLGEMLCHLVDNDGRFTGEADTGRNRRVTVVHAGVRVFISVGKKVEEEVEEWKGIDQGGRRVETYLSCSLCGAKTDKRLLRPSTLLLSFGKFLELMIYSKGIWTWSNTRTDDSTTIDRTVESQTRGCLHQGPHSLAKSEEIQGPLEHTRNVNPSLVRHFVLMRVENGTSEVTFRRDLVGVTPLLPNPPSAPTSSARVFEIVGPRMQIRSRAGEASKRNETTQNVLKEDLKREMARFWESIDKRLDSIIERTDHRRQQGSTASSSQSDSRLKQLKDLWMQEELYKSLPGLPLDERDGDPGEDSTGDGERTPTVGGGGSGTVTPTQPPQSFASEKGAEALTALTSLSDLKSESKSDISIAPSLPPKDPPPPLLPSRQPVRPNPLQTRIQSLRTTLRATERRLNGLLTSVPVDRLNDVRRKFWDDGGRVLSVLGALEGAVGGSFQETARMSTESVPEWWKSPEYRIPPRRGCVLVREGDWGSVIGHVLSLSITPAAQTKAQSQRDARPFSRQHLNLNRTLPRTPVDHRSSMSESESTIHARREGSQASDSQITLSDWERALGLSVGSNWHEEDEWLHVHERHDEDAELEVERLSGAEVLLKKSRSKAKAKTGPKPVQGMVPSVGVGDLETAEGSTSVLSSTSTGTEASTSTLILPGLTDQLERSDLPPDEDLRDDPITSTSSSASTIRLLGEVKAMGRSVPTQTASQVENERREVEDEVVGEALVEDPPPVVPPKDHVDPSRKKERERELPLPPLPSYTMGVGSGFVAFQKIQSSLASGFHHVIAGVAGVQGAVAGLGGGGEKPLHISKGGTAKEKKATREQKTHRLLMELTKVEEKPHVRYTFVLPDRHHREELRPSPVQPSTTSTPASSTQSSGFTLATAFGSTVGASAAPVSETGSAMQFGKKGKEKMSNAGDDGGLKVSCTVYYSRQFASLRALCSSNSTSPQSHETSYPESELPFIQSISSTLSWSDVEGGKSRSGFWKTKDGKYVIKELVRPRWPGGVDDLQTLLSLAPSYFEHLAQMESEQSPSVLVKLVGFYTIEMEVMASSGTGDIGTTATARSGATPSRSSTMPPTPSTEDYLTTPTDPSQIAGSSGSGKTKKPQKEKRKIDVLVMENLFHGRDVNGVYDMKGIIGRRKGKGKDKAKGKEEEEKRSTSADRGGKGDVLTSDLNKDSERQTRAGLPKTLFDGDWLDAHSRPRSGSDGVEPLLVWGWSKAALDRSIENDTAFLEKRNVMDYSLLVGIDETRREIVCGLVDTLGTYTFAKTLEYAAKHNFHMMQGLPAAVTTPALSMSAFSSSDAVAQIKREGGEKEKASSKKGKDGASGARKEVTVLPPAEYRARFLGAISGKGDGNLEERGYFFVCPDKWSSVPSNMPEDGSGLPGGLCI